MHHASRPCHSSGLADQLVLLVPVKWRMGPFVPSNCIRRMIMKLSARMTCQKEMKVDHETCALYYSSELNENVSSGGYIDPVVAYFVGWFRGHG